MSQLSQEYQLFRRILCVCPCCNKIVRVSELKLKAKGDRKLILQFRSLFETLARKDE